MSRPEIAWLGLAAIVVGFVDPQIGSTPYLGSRRYLFLSDAQVRVMAPTPAEVTAMAIPMRLPPTHGRIEVRQIAQGRPSHCDAFDGLLTAQSPLGRAPVA